MSKPTMTINAKTLCLLTGLSLGLIAPIAAHADRTISYTYTPQGQIETIDGPRVDVTDITTYGYDGQGNRTSITNALNQTTQVTAHDASGRPLTILSPNDLTTTRSYDLRGRMTQQSVTDGATTRTTDYDYDAVGNLIQVTLPDGNSITYDYDAAHRLTGLEDQLGNRIDYTLDDMGNRLNEQVSDPQGTLTRTQQKVYDQLSQLDQSIDSQNHTTDFDYDANGNLTRTLDANLNPTVQDYDPLDRLEQTTDAKNGITQYSYDAQDNLIEVTDPTNLTTIYDYDELDNLLSVTSPDTGVTTYTYDEAGNRLTQTDARGVTASYSYDALNRLTTISYPDTSLNVSYTYDQGTHGIGQLTQMSDAEGTTDYVYNTFGDLIEQTRTSQDALVTSFTYTYNPQGQLISQTYPSGHIVHYSYTQGQLTGLSLEKPDGTTQALVSQIQRLPFGPINTLDFGNGLQLSRTFDQDYKLIAQTLGNVLNDSYGHDPVGNITDWQDLLQTARDQSFSYDELDRLTNATGAYGDLGYSYDAIGNRLNKTEDGVSETYSYETDSHRLQEILGSTTDSRLYDEAGNTLSSLIGGYTYDDQNRMVGFTQGSTVASYGYNGKGERVRKTVNGVITRFRYGPSGALLGEYDQTGESLREYVYLEGQPIALLSSQSGIPVIDFDQNPVLSYGGTGQDINGTEVAQGSSLTLAGNVWKKIAFNYTITPNTILEFDFESGEQGEVHGIGFDTDDIISSDRSFELYGSHNWGIRDYKTYNGSGVEHYQILVGDYYTGPVDRLFFINDQDVSEPTAESRFSNIRVYEAGESGEIATGLVYLHTDHLEAVVKATDEVQAVVWDVDRKPFGERESLVGQVEVPLGFPGQYYDEETGNYYNYFRDYDPATGRYLQSDPIGLEGGINTYGYVGANPSNFIDRYGLFFQGITIVEAVGGLINTIGGMVVVNAAHNSSNSGSQSQSGSGSSDCKTCKTEYPNYILCSSLREYYYNSRRDALRSFRVQNGRLVNPDPATGGLCADSDGAGMHWNVHVNGFGYIGSITSCTCCQDSPNGPTLKTKFRAH